MPSTMLDILDSAVSRYGDRPALSMRRDDATLEAWTYREFERRARIAAWRLRALGLEPGDRILTWSPSCPELAATYFGAMRARLITVPLDMRMSPDAISGVVASAGPRRLILGTGHDAPNPADAGLEAFPTTTVDEIAADPDDTFPADWEAQLAAWEAPKPEEIFELIFTSGTTSAPKGVMLGHDNVVASVHSFNSLVPPMEHRLVSLLPLSHLLEQSVGLFYATSVGADIHYVRSRNPRVIFDALRERRVTSMVLVPQFIDLFWGSLQREVDKRGLTRVVAAIRPVARRMPVGVRRLLFRSIHSQLGGSFRLFLSAGAYLPPAVQQAWEDIGVTILQGYGSTETGTGCCTTLDDHGLGTVGRPAEGMQVKLAEDGEILFKGPSLFHGYWNDPKTTAEAFTSDGWYRSGDIGRWDDHGRLILSGRKKDIIVLPNGFNVYPEDIENALRIAGVRDAVVVETEPGRIEAVVLASAVTAGLPRADAAAVKHDPAALKGPLDAAVKAANGTLGANQRIAAWRLWPEDDFPRTHTLKVKRAAIREWVAADTPLPVR
jgi:long-chain acyl-CoA synthetase